MSTITDIYDDFISFMTTTYSSRKRLVDSENIDQNSDLVLESGWGIRLESAQNTDLLQNRGITVERSFIVVFTDMSEGIWSDVTIRDTAIKRLLNAQAILLENVRNDRITTKPLEYDFASDGGILEIVTDKRNFLAIETDILVQYIDFVGGC